MVSSLAEETGTLMEQPPRQEGDRFLNLCEFGDLLTLWTSPLHTNCLRNKDTDKLWLRPVLDELFQLIPGFATFYPIGFGPDPSCKAAHPDNQFVSFICISELVFL